MLLGMDTAAITSSDRKALEGLKIYQVRQMWPPVLDQSSFNRHSVDS